MGGAMTNISGGGCRKHRRVDPMATYDRLPPEVRRGLQLAPVNFCPGCVASALRRHGLDWTIRQLAEARRHEPLDGGVWVAVEPLRP
jgi:hypothetical protein